MVYTLKKIRHTDADSLDQYLTVNLKIRRTIKIPCDDSNERDFLKIYTGK